MFSATDDESLMGDELQEGNMPDIDERSEDAETENGLETSSSDEDHDSQFEDESASEASPCKRYIFMSIMVRIFSL